MKWFWWFLILVVGQLRSAAGSSASDRDGDPGSSPAGSDPAGASSAGVDPPGPTAGGAHAGAAALDPAAPEPTAADDPARAADPPGAPSSAAAADASTAESTEAAPAVEPAEIPNSVLDSGYDPRLATQVMGMTPEPTSQDPVPGAAGEGGEPGSTNAPDKKAAPSDAPGDATAGATDADEEIDSRSQH